MSDNFYRAFEDLHRGQRSDIFRRLQVYLPFVLPVAKANPHAPCIDLGCGRGEWLQLLTEHNLNALGVDLDLGMLAAAQSMGLNARQSDAIEALREVSDGSIAVVTAFHLVEHLPFECLQELVIQAKRVLVPGGLLIMETPSPDNLRVATNNFYLDPSHLKPIPSLLLSFVSEHAGFVRTKILGLQENPALRFQAEVQLQDVLAGASPDYAVITQTAGSGFPDEQLNAAFERDYGISTTDLAQSYAQQQKLTVKALRAEIHDQRELVHREVNDLRQLQMHSAEHIAQLKNRIDLLENQLQAIQSSVLWPIARSLKWAADQYVKLRQHGLKTRWLAFLRKVGWVKTKSHSKDHKPD